MVKDASGLPQSLRDTAARLPLIQSSLTIAAHGIKEDSDAPEAYAALEAVLQACSDRAFQLHHIFEAMIPSVGSTRTHRLLKAVRSFPQVDNANVLVEGILADLQVLTLNHVVRSATREQIKELMGTPTKHAVERDAAVTLNNNGIGRQYVHTGQGNQNIACHSATQINGNFNGGAFNFTSR
ncbi:hypothetical protein FLONG3_6625 [Fusarium longipes]|uniref:NACHT-NTPase and P-loop NTPases N-terminal domain-containing protein n=1 Tax=Fusarium longipes TaxID=694270 RepID=A0A395SKJ2_9HYPO|nr:hypothetical protein FLONG3_6625 [Fusarium longipes]